MATSMPFLNPEITFEWLRQNFTGKGVRVAVIDSGIDATHPALNARISQTCHVVTDVSTGSARVDVLPAPIANDVFGHGTAVAGILSSIAPDVEIVDVRVLNDLNSCTGDILAAGLDWALDQGIRLINLSVATTRPQYRDPLLELAERAFVAEAVLVASKKNFGPIGFPAAFSSVVSVDRGDALSDLALRFRPYQLVQYEAHGTKVVTLTPGGGHNEQTGTSFATPRVTGVIALLQQAFPGIRPVEVKALLNQLGSNQPSPSVPTET